MTNLKKILAMVLVLAMTLTMLPVFAAADEVAAVETVEAPAAEPAPAPAEAPAAEPVAAPIETAAVEEVAEIPAAPAEAAPVEAAPVAEAIETVAAESLAPKAELQATYASDAEAIEAGYFLKNTAPDSSVQYYNTLASAFSAANSWTSPGKIELIADWDLVNPAVTAPLTKTYTNNTDPDCEIQGPWFDLGGHTLIIAYGSGEGNSSLIPFRSSNGANQKYSFKNGTIIGRSRGITGAYRGGLICTNYTSTGAPSSGGTANVNTITFKDMNVVTLRVSTSSSGNTMNPVVYIGNWQSVINVYDSTLISEDGPAFRLKKNAYVTSSGYVPVDHTVNIYGTSYVGSVCKDTGRSSETVAIQGAYASSSNLESGTHNITINLSDDAVLVGQKAYGTTTNKYTVTVNKIGAGNTLTPTTLDQITYSYNLPDRDSVPETALGEVTEANNPITYAGMVDDYTAFKAHDHVQVHHDAAEPSYAADGNYEYYSCSGCDVVWEADGETETTLEAVTRTRLVCSHPDLEHVAASIGAYDTRGNVEYWYCPTCLRYFSDSTCETETDFEATRTVKRTDVTPGATDAELVALGALVRVTHPDGTETAYDDINTGYGVGASWTTAGGVVKLIRDYTFVDTGTGAAAAFVNAGYSSTTTNHANEYANADIPTINGFWFDLGGHTLSMRSGHCMFYQVSNVPLNIRNGRILYQNTTYTGGTTLGIIKGGYTSNSVSNGSTNMYHPHYTFKDLTMIKLPHASGKKAGPTIFMPMAQSTINVIDSNIIGETGDNAFYYYKSISTSDAAYVESQPWSHTLNISGDSTVGVPGSSKAILIGQDQGTAAASYSFTVNISGDDVKFLGGAIYENKNASLTTGLTGFPEDYISVPGTMVLPSTATLAEETTIDAVPSDSASATSVTYWKKPIDTSLATFTPAGGSAGAEKTLLGAFQDWAAAGYSGTVTLVNSPSDTAIAILRDSLGGSMTYNDSAKETNSANYRLLIPAAAEHGNLTLDCAGYTIATNAFLATDPGLNDFTLKLENGTVSATSGPCMVLKGSNIGFYLDNMTLTTTGGNFVQDCRGDGSYSIFTDSVLNSDTRAPVAVFAWSGNVDADPVLYYVKDCTISASFTGGTKQSPILRIEVGSLTNRKCVMVFDGDNTISAAYYNSADESKIFYGYDSETGDYKYAFFLTAHGAIGSPVGEMYTLTTDSSSSKLCAPADAAATLTVGTELTLPFTNLSDAVKYAQLFGACALDTTLTLNKDVTVAESISLGKENYDSEIALNLNGKTLTDSGNIGLFSADGSSEVAITVTGAFGDAATEAKFFAGVPALAYASGNDYVVAKGSMFSSWSLNLEDSVTINLYTATADPDAVYYVQDGTQHTITTKDAADAWVIDTLAAKQMSETVDAYAVKTSGTTTTIDFAKDISVKNYVAKNPASQVEAGDNHDAIVEALNATLDTMMIYGKLAEKFFDDDFTDLSAADLEAIGVDAVPETVTTNLEHADRTVTGMGDHTTDSTVGSGFWGSAAVLEDSISLKFYFYGAEFDGASATVQIGEAAATAATLETNGSFKYVQTAVAAKDFDTAITVAVAGVGSVTDSVEAYTARIGSGENHYKLAQALRAYGADAKRFYEAKNP